jgi:CRP/FNR family transcriptional regulator, cyclic AMP receptor protein
LTSGTDPAGDPPGRFNAPLVRVLEADPDLGAGIEREQWDAALNLAVAPEFEFERGPWHFRPPSDRGGLGALVLEGLILLRMHAGERGHIELLGQGDVVCPWVDIPAELTVPFTVSARAVADVRIAMLDRRFALRTARWPEIHAAVVERLVLRSRMLSLQATVNSLPKIEERIELTLWQLGFRFGRMTRDGITLHLPITHAQLAEIVSAQRPSVSMAISRLEARGRVARTGRHEWLLRGEPPTTLTPLAG